MILKNVKVRNFRSLLDLDAPMQAYSCLIGRNDAGKSSFLRAVELLLDPTARLAETDRSLLAGAGDTVIVEGHFLEVPPQAVIANGTSAKLRRTIGPTSDIYEFEGQVPTSECLKRMSVGTLTKKELDLDNTIDAEIRLKVQQLPKGLVKAEAWMDLYKEVDALGLVQKAPGWAPTSGSVVAELFDVVFLTADMRAQEETADSPRSVFGKLGGILFREACRAHPELSERREALAEVLESLASRTEDGKWAFESIQKLEEVIQEELGRFDPDVKVCPRPTPPKMPSLDFRFDLDVEDPHVQGVTSMGHGLRRSLVFAMLRAVARLDEIAPAVADGDDVQPIQKFTMFLVEEPELYLHPQAERARMRDLRELGDRTMTQVLACTHSAFFVDFARYRSVLRLERPGRLATKCHHWTGLDLDADEQEKLKAVRAMHPTSAAALFADLAIIAEGPTEVGSMPGLAVRLNLDVKGVEVVDCGGAGNVPIVSRICDALGVKYTAWFDQDRPDDIQKVTDAATAGRMALVVLHPDWEGVGGVPAGGGGKPWRSYKHFILDGNPPPPDLEAAIRAAYQHQSFDMRPTAGGTP